MAGAGRSVSGKIVLSLCDFEQQQLGNTVVSGRLNVVNGLKRTNQIVSLGRS
jgi:hypothetical protein